MSCFVRSAKVQGERNFTSLLFSQNPNPSLVMKNGTVYTIFDLQMGKVSHMGVEQADVTTISTATPWVGLDPGTKE